MQLGSRSWPYVEGPATELWLHRQLREGGLVMRLGSRMQSQAVERAKKLSWGSVRMKAPVTGLCSWPLVGEQAKQLCSSSWVEREMDLCSSPWVEQAKVLCSLQLVAELVAELVKVLGSLRPAEGLVMVPSGHMRPGEGLGRDRCGRGLGQASCRMSPASAPFLAGTSPAVLLWCSEEPWHTPQTAS